MDQLLADLLDLLEKARTERDAAGRSEAGRVLALAYTDLQSAENWVRRAIHEYEGHSAGLAMPTSRG
jgi:hypothetical protein